jgi:dTDP-4-amino-4,6-dideoxygalactose transaminase
MQVPPFDLTEQLHQLGEALEDAVLQVLRSGQYIGGATIARFEQQFAQAVGAPHAIGCNSGTDALVLALRGLGIGEGDEVITSSFSFFATAEAISAVGATPVFVDVDDATYLIDLELIEAAITPATRAVMPVHLFGRPVDMERLGALAAAHDLLVIEDCAQATGASWAGRPVGSWGDAGCFSFFPTKNLGGAGDGGAVTCRDPALAARIRELAVHGMPRRYLHTSLGYNSRLDALQAAVLSVKLPHLPEWVERRRHLADTYRRELADLQGLCPAGTGPQRPQLEPVRGAHPPLPSSRGGLWRQLRALRRQRRLRTARKLLPRLAEAGPGRGRREHDHLLPDPDPPAWSALNRACCSCGSRSAPGSPGAPGERSAGDQIAVATWASSGNQVRM